MRNTCILLFLFFIFHTTAQNSWYVDRNKGSNSNTGKTPNQAVKTVDFLIFNQKIQPKDTVFIIDEYHNPSYNPKFKYKGDKDRNNPHLWHGENTIKLNNLNGKPNQFITFKPYNQHTVLKGDGSNIIRITNCSFIQIIDFEIEGEVKRIPLSTTEGLTTDGLQFLYLATNTKNKNKPTLKDVLYRVNIGTSIKDIEKMKFKAIGKITRPSYIDTRGIYVSNSHHINIKNNIIHHMPGGGLRVASSSNIQIIGNEIHNCSRRSYSGTHALVVTKTKPGKSLIDDDLKYSIIINQNKVHHNYNEIFSWVGTKTFITPRIDEGKGISLQRNNSNKWQKSNKRILIQNNLCYQNGFSGIHSNDGWHIDIINNTSYMNSYTNSVTYKSNPKGKNIGISSQRGNDIKIINNISYIKASWNAYPITASKSKNLFISDNLIYNAAKNEMKDPDIILQNLIVEDPKFKNPKQANFCLKKTSPAIDKANIEYAPEKDFCNSIRDEKPDIGAIEYIKL